MNRGWVTGCWAERGVSGEVDLVERSAVTLGVLPVTLFHKDQTGGVLIFTGGEWLEGRWGAEITYFSLCFFAKWS